MEAFLALVLFCLIVLFVAVPLWRRPETESTEQAAERERTAALAELEARKEAKYREIRDTELDQASGKLSAEAFKRQDAELRAEAVEILERIDNLREQSSGEQPPAANP
jgi:flagellar biosynthesis/type III secretory pathway M-ring protein FliF/YscJ